MDKHFLMKGDGLGWFLPGVSLFIHAAPPVKVRKGPQGSNNIFSFPDNLLGRHSKASIYISHNTDVYTISAVHLRDKLLCLAGSL